MSICFVVISALLPILSFAQGDKYFIKTWSALSQRNVELGAKLADSTLTFYELENNEYGIAKYNFLLGGIAKQKGDYHQADSLFNVFSSVAIIIT